MGYFNCLYIMLHFLLSSVLSHIPGTIVTVNLVDGRYVERTTFLVCSVSCEPDRLTVNLVDGKAGKNDTYDRSKEFRRI